MSAKNEHRRRRRIDLAERRLLRQVARQVVGGGIDGRLHVARGAVDVAVEIELHRDRGLAERALRGDFRHPGNFSQPPLEGSSPAAFQGNNQRLSRDLDVGLGEIDIPAAARRQGPVA